MCARSICICVDPVILLGSYVCYTQQIRWVHFEAFIAETYVQLVTTELCATLLADLSSLGAAATARMSEMSAVLYCTVA